MKKLVASLVIAGLMTGCVGFPKDYEKPVTINDVAGEMRDSWSSTPAYSFVQSMTGTVTRKHSELPPEVANIPVNFDFDKEYVVTLGDVVFALRAQGLKVISRMSKESEAAPWLIYNYSGNLGDLVAEITDVNNLGFELRRGTVYITEGNQYSVAMPQHKAFLEQVKTAIGSKGATDIQVDLQAGQIHYRAKPDDADSIQDYLQAVSKNSAMINLQVAVLTVGMNRDVQLGLDWATLGAKVGRNQYRGDQLVIQNSVASGNSLVGGTTGSSNSSSSGGTSDSSVVGNTTEAATKHLIGSLLGYTGGSGFNFQMGTNAFSLSTAIKALSTYGTARTDQNVILSTLSGLGVKISSGNDIPYVKSIGSATSAGGSVSGSSNTEIIKSGLEVDVTPYFDAADGTVSTESEVSLKSLVGFRELSAGTNLGTLSQPEMQNLDFKNFGRIPAGETIVMGGVTYDQVNTNHNNLPGLETLPTGSKADKITRNAIYIVLRPTVTLFTPDAAALNAAYKDYLANQSGKKVEATSPNSLAARALAAPAPRSRIMSPTVEDVAARKEAPAAPATVEPTPVVAPAPVEVIEVVEELPVIVLEPIQGAK